MVPTKNRSDLPLYLNHTGLPTHETVQCSSAARCFLFTGRNSYAGKYSSGTSEGQFHW